MNIVSSVHEGFQNVPKLYGSDVREPGKVTNFSSGVREAGKVRQLVPSASTMLTCWRQGFFYGYYDGITGLVREPIQGAKKEVRGILM